MGGNYEGCVARKVQVGIKGKDLTVFQVSFYRPFLHNPGRGLLGRDSSINTLMVLPPSPAGFFSFFFFFFLFLFGLFRAAPAPYGGSQARGLIGAAAAGLHCSHSNAGSEPHL